MKTSPDGRPVKNSEMEDLQVTFDSPGSMQMKYATLLLGDTDDQYGLEVGTLICVGSVLALDYLPVLCCLFWLCVCVCASF